MTTSAITKPYKGMGMEGRIATWYARNTARDLPEFVRLADRIGQALPQPSRILEVAPGPGYLSVELAKRGHHEVAALDISQTFVAMVRERAREGGVAVDVQHGDASAMPFADASFDFVVCRAAFKNFTRPLEAINEMDRVLRPGGRALVIDLRKGASMRDISEYVRRTGLGFVDAWMTRLTFRFMLLPRSYSVAQFHDLAARSAFPDWDVRTDTIGMELELRKDAAGK